MMIELLKTQLKRLISEEATRTGLAPADICIIYKDGLFYFCYNAKSSNLDLKQFTP